MPVIEIARCDWRPENDASVRIEKGVYWAAVNPTAQRISGGILPDGFSLMTMVGNVQSASLWCFNLKVQGPNPVAVGQISHLIVSSSKWFTSFFLGISEQGSAGYVHPISEKTATLAVFSSVTFVLQSVHDIIYTKDLTTILSSIAGTPETPVMCKLRGLAIASIVSDFRSYAKVLLDLTVLNFPVGWDRVFVLIIPVCCWKWAIIWVSARNHFSSEIFAFTHCYYFLIRFY